MVKRGKTVRDPSAPKPVTTTAPKPKKKKDPLAPKLPLSSFMEFGKQERSKIKADLGIMTLSEVGRELGRRWRGLGKDQKEVFEKKSKENRATYNMEKEMFEKERLEKESLESNEGSPNPVPDSSSDLQAQDAHSVLRRVDDDSMKESIELSDLGFARQKNFPWHPALRIGTLARGTRVKVTFFGTGQSGIVDKSKWLVYSDQAEDRIKTPNLMKTSAFKLGLQQMKNLRNKMKRDQGVPVSDPGIDFTPQIGSRRFKALNKDHLQKEEEENFRQMEKKMRQEDESKVWTCRDCNWKGKFSHKAKAHARDCGQRRRSNTKECAEKKFECSNGDCGRSFALKSQLLRHYR